MKSSCLFSINQLKKNLHFNYNNHNNSTIYIPFISNHKTKSSNNERQGKEEEEEDNPPPPPPRAKNGSLHLTVHFMADFIIILCL